MKKILIADDEVSLLKGLADKFSISGFSVITARDGGEALQKAVAEHPDLIILDILMPHMDGFEMIALLRQDEWGKTARIVVWSNSKNNEKMTRATDLGITEFWTKSDYTFTQIVEKTRVLLEK